MWSGGKPSFTTIGLLIALACVGLITLAHSIVGFNDDNRRVIHLVLGWLYLFPVIAASALLGRAAGITVAAITSGAFLVHIHVSWHDQPMQNINQFALIAVFWLTSMVTGSFKELVDAEKKRRLDSEEKTQRESMLWALASLSNALRARDEYTREHSEQVANVATAIANRLKLSPEKVEQVRLAALVHDIGKIGVRDDVLLNHKALTSEERAKIEAHPSIAADIVRPLKGTETIAAIVLTHHECPDGTGYPLHLSDKDIPFESHIVRVADVFSSLIEKRPYKEPMSIEQALRTMESMVPKKLDESTFGTLNSLIQDGDLCASHHAA